MLDNLLDQRNDVSFMEMSRMVSCSIVRFYMHTKAQDV